MQQTGRQGDDGSAFFFQHYEHSISGWAYSLKDDGKGNYLRFVLDFIRDPRCPPDSAFRLAVLAWTAKHWAVTCQPGDTTWRSFYDRAMATMQRLEEQDSDGSPDLSTSGHQVMASASEVIICSTLFLCRCDVLNDDLNSILNHLEALKLRLDAHLSGPPLSAFASQILLWLGYLHVRVSIFAPSPVANTPQDGSVATTLLDVIASHPTYEQIVNRSQTYLVEIFGESYPPEELLQDAEKAPVAVRTHETFCLIANMLRYRSWKRLATQKGVSSDQLELEKAKVEAIDVDIRRMDVEFGLAMATNPSAAVIRRICFQSAPAPPLSTFSMTNTQFVSSPGSTGVSPVSQSMLQHGSSDESLNRASSQWLACYAVFLTAKILWSRFLHPTARSDSSAATAVKSILSIALHLRRAHEASSPSTSWPHKIPRSMLWPLPLFIAGVETTDEVHADWIRGFMNEVTSSWGGEVAMSAKTRDLHKPVGQRDGCDTNGPNRVQILMGRVRRLQDQLGCRVDIESVVRDMSDESGRGFIL
ncbi:fungal specific transcription factor domain-containing protein [Purpureocillium lavendulum]|uniref:Fungal specific transcription factor domain-containing protein n=1 Tax=Purpureocillium lavendulum TaxID=1247861 RepID=A0AB34FMP8_9HYPO|nr:fungal specific transcription factor domain-containing protein [Purpureocillium lavendulum]